MELLPFNDENNYGVSPQALKDARLDMLYEIEPQKATANYRLCNTNVSQIDHVTSIASTVNKVYQNFIENGGLPPTHSKKKTHLFVSDCHDDAVPMLAQLVFSKSFKIDPTKLVAVNIDKGIIYRTIDEIRTAKEQLDRGKLTHEDTYSYEDRKDRLVYFPLMEYIPNSEEKEEIELYLGGDYGDRGPESAVNYAILRYLQALKNEQEIKNVHVLAGNHEIEIVCGTPSIMAPLDNDSKSYLNITNDLFEKNFFEFCITKETEKGLLVFSHAPHTICNLPAIILLTKTLLSNLEDVENEQFKNSIDDFRQSKQILIQELEKSQPLYEKITNLVESGKINWEDFNFVFDRQTIPEADSSLKQTSINLYNEIQNANFTAKDIFDWINILGHAARNLQFFCPACDTFTNDEYSLLRNMLSATRSDKSGKEWSNLGWLVGERLRDDFIDLLWKDVFLSIFGHTPDTDMAFDLNAQFLNTDVRLGTREGGAKSKDYSSINFTFVNEDGELFLTNYKVDRDKDKKVTGTFEKLPAKIKIKNNDTVKVINAPNEVEITKSVEDKNEKDKTLSENNDNGNHDFHDDSDSHDNDNDNDNKPDAPKIKLQNLSPETSTDSDIENNNDNDDNNNHHKNNFLDEIKLNLGKFIRINEIITYLINIIEDKKKKLLQKAKEIHEELNVLFKYFHVIQNLTKEEISISMEEFENANVEEKLNILAFYDNEQIELQSQYEEFIKLISNSLLEKIDKDYLINIVNNPEINFSAKVTTTNSYLKFLFSKQLPSIGINTAEEKIPYLIEYDKLPIENRIEILNNFARNIYWEIVNYIPKTKTQNELSTKICRQLLERKSISEIKNDSDSNEDLVKIFIEHFNKDIENDEDKKDVELFRKESFDNKLAVLKSIYKYEQQNKLNNKNPDFVDKIPPLEQNDAQEI